MPCKLASLPGGLDTNNTIPKGDPFFCTYVKSCARSPYFSSSFFRFPSFVSPFARSYFRTGLSTLSPNMHDWTLWHSEKDCFTLFCFCCRFRSSLSLSLGVIRGGLDVSSLPGRRWQRLWTCGQASGAPDLGREKVCGVTDLGGFARR